MEVAVDRVVRIEYVLCDVDGVELDRSDEEAVAYLHGHGQLAEGLERQLEGKRAGARLQVEVSAAEGYGEHDPDQVVEVPRSDLPDELTPELGIELLTEGPDGEEVPLRIVGVDHDSVTLDGNHPFAGQDLRFTVEIKDVRAATEEELEHGHVHGEDAMH